MHGRSISKWVFIGKYLNAIDTNHQFHLEIILYITTLVEEKVNTIMERTGRK